MSIKLNNLTSKPYKAIAQLANSAANKVGEQVIKAQKSDKFNKIIGQIEPTGANNAALPLFLLMSGPVLIPRVTTAMKRNPDNKEATKDEVIEILFRDVQSILIVFFAFKSMNALVGSMATKLKGLPMINRPYKKLFNSESKGLQGIQDKAREIIEHPVEKIKTISKNLLDTLNPISGVSSLTNETYQKSYSGFESIKDIKKLFKTLPEGGGDGNKVFNKVMDDLIEQQNTLLNGNSKQKTMGLIQQAKATMSDGKYTEEMQLKINNAQALKEHLEETKKAGFSKFMEEKELNKDVEENLISYFKDENNPLVYGAKKLNAWLRTITLAIESAYLGFGLPALNEKRLEKKYLKEQPMGLNPASDTYTPLNDKTIKAQEIKLYSNFIK